MNNDLTLDLIEEFLYAVDKSFIVPLSQKQKLKDFAEKLFNYATICAEKNENKIISMVAGYTDNLVDNLSYITLVATLDEARGIGLASKCVRKFIEVCKEKDISAVHLYTDASNEKAKSMYRKIGFVEYKIENEPRPKDVHLIYRIEKE